MKPNISEKDFLDYYKSSLDDDQPTETVIVEKPARTSRVPLILVGIVVLFASLSAAGYVLFGMAAKATTVAVAIEGPSEAANGSESLFSVIIANSSGVPLSDTSLIASFPDGFTLLSASDEPKNSKKNYWPLGTIQGYEHRTLLLRGTLSGSLGEKKIISLSFQYHQKGVSAEFESHAEHTIALTSSALALRLSGPTQAQPSEVVSYRIEFDDFSAFPKKDEVEIRVTPPPGFRTNSQTPKPSHDFVWDAKTLLKAVDEKSKAGSITLTGSYADSSSPTGYALEASIGTVVIGEFFASETEKLETALTARDTVVRLLVNGAMEPRPLQMDAPIAITIPIENKGALPLTNLSATLSLSSPLIDWLRMENPNGGIIKSGTITWTDRDFSGLKLLKNGEKTVVNLVLHFKKIAELPASLAGTDSAGDPLALALTISVKGSKLGAKGDSLSETPLFVEPISLTLPVSSDTRFAASDSQNGMVRWTVTNSLHELSNLTIVGRLTDDIAWSDTSASAEAGSIDYDSKSKKVTWSLNRMPQSVPSLVIELNGLSSTTPQMSEQIFTATDSKTGGIITITR